MAWLSLRGDRLLEVDAVLFDKDGTLSISQPHLLALGHCRLRACASLLPDEPAKAVEPLLRQVYGLGHAAVEPAGVLAVASRHDNLIATASTLRHLGLSWPDALAVAEQAFDACDADRPGRDHGESALSDGAGELIQALQTSGVRCAVISNDSADGIRRFLAHHHLLERIDAIWSADDRPRKPDPAAVAELCRRIGCRPERCALIGDADSDFTMARGAGVPLTLAYLSAWSEPPTLARAHESLHHWQEISVAPGA
ncbi:HAD family hydrolase [Synechococcus sp. RSCCF101]|uniref:HAD family hydrolase n=1 Tax=Synechococcus sp. RSCCF101 TaxID=2511069 RepID=UPI001243F7DA|nr:HAD family hydrolase [Synechococcus sp. RSCCF101]QEY32121.1 HAD family hydrolase [Synechococcus sp. RSCCF101]